MKPWVLFLMTNRLVRSYNMKKGEKKSLNIIFDPSPHNNQDEKIPKVLQYFPLKLHKKVFDDWK